MWTKEGQSFHVKSYQFSRVLLKIRFVYVYIKAVVFRFICLPMTGLLLRFDCDTHSFTFTSGLTLFIASESFAIVYSPLLTANVEKGCLLTALDMPFATSTPKI